MRPTKDSLTITYHHIAIHYVKCIVNFVYSIFMQNELTKSKKYFETELSLKICTPQENAVDEIGCTSSDKTDLKDHKFGRSAIMFMN